jgi:hypothetical protein
MFTTKQFLAATAEEQSRLLKELDEKIEKASIPAKRMFEYAKSNLMELRLLK